MIETGLRSTVSKVLRLARCLAACAVAASLALGGAGTWADPPAVEGNAKGQASEAQKRQQTTAEIQRLIRESNRLRAAGKLEDAVGVGGKAVGLARTLDGDVSETVAGLEDWLAPLHESREDWPAARLARETALVVRRSLYGENDWRITNARLALADVDLHMRLDPKGRRELADAEGLTNQARALRQMGEAGKGIPLANQALEINRRLLGAKHPLVSTNLNDLGVLYGSLNQETQAESFYRQALDGRRKILGNEHPETALCLNNLASVADAKGELAKAEGLHLEALEIRRRTFGERHAATAQSFDALAAIRTRIVAQKMQNGDFAAARQTQGDLQQLLAGRYGERNWRVVDARLRLADVDFYERLSAEDREQLKVADAQEAERRRLVTQRQYREAFPSAERALAIRRRLEGDEHPDTLRCVYEISGLYASLKEYDKAESLAGEVLTLRTKVLGEEHPDTADTLNSMGKLRELQGNDAQAGQFYRRALSIRSRVFGPRHVDTLATFDSLVALEQKQAGRHLADGKHAEARRELDDVVRLLALRYGARDWRVTDARLKRSDVDLDEKLSPDARAQLKEADRHDAESRRLDERGKWRDALSHAEQSLKIRKDIQGESHYATAKTLNQVAVMNARLDEHAQAGTLYIMSLAASEKVLGDFHPNTLQCAKNLANSYAAREEYDKAEPLWRKVLEIQQKMDGDKAAETLAAWDRLLGLHATMVARSMENSDYAAAQKIQSDTLRLVARRYGESDWHVTDARLKLRDIEFEEKLSPQAQSELKHIVELGAVRRQLFDQGRYREALVPEEETLAIRKRILGDGHPDTAVSLNNVAVLYEKLHADAKVEPLYRQALEIRRKVLGELNPQTAGAIEQMATFYFNRAKLDQAEPLYREALAIRQRLLGEKDSSTVDTFNRLMNLYARKASTGLNSADYAAARKIQVESIRLLAQRYGERNWQVTDARLKLRDMDLRQRLTPEGRADLRKAAELDAERLRLFEQDRYREALAPALEGLEIRKRLLGTEHPDTADCLNFVGLLYQNVKDIAKAEPYYRQALEVRKKILGEEHPDTALSLHNLAYLCRDKGDDAQAEALYLRAVEIRMRLLGKGHNLTISSFNELVALQPAMVARALAAGDYSTASRIQDELVRVLLAKFGEKDRRSERAREELRDIESRAKLSAEAREDLKRAGQLQEEGRRLFEKHQYREALVPALEVFDIRLKALGLEHADTIASYNNVDLLYQKAIGERLQSDDYALASRIEVEWARLIARRYGEKDWRVAEVQVKQQVFDQCAHLPPEGMVSLKRRGALEQEITQLSSKGAYREALRPTEEAIALYRKLFGEGHPETGRWLNYAGGLHSRLKEYALAEKDYGQVLAIDKKMLGDEHPQTAFALSNLAGVYYFENSLEKAATACREALAIRRKVLGETHADTRDTYDHLANIERTIADQRLAKGEYESARQMWDELVGLLRQRYGEKDWHVTDARLSQHDVQLRQRLSPEQQAELKRVLELQKQELQKYGERKYEDSVALQRQALEIRKRIFGEEHRDTALGYKTLGDTLTLTGDRTAARQMYERALTIRRKLLGEEHRDTGVSYIDLAVLLEAQGDFAAAMHHAERALAIQRKISGENDLETAYCQLTLGDLLLATGECTAARGYFERALQTRRKAKGENHPDVAALYTRLAIVDVALGDRATARRNVERALAIYLKARGEEDPGTASLYCSLGNLDSSSGDYSSARTNYERALAIARKVGGDECQIAANCYAGLGAMFRDLHDYPAARQDAERMLAIYRKLYGEEHRLTATACNELAVILQDLGEFAEARRKLELALAIDRKLLGEEHQTTALIHQNLGTLSLDQGDYAAALAEQEKSLAATQGFLSRMFGALSEDQQLALEDNVRSCLDEYLTSASFTHADDGAVYGWLLKCKGAVTAEQFLIRLQRRKAGVARLFDELQATATRLSALDGELSELSASVSNPNQREKRLQDIQQEIRQLNARNEALQQQLVAKNSGFRQAKESANLRPDDIRKALPPKSALVDFTEYLHTSRVTPGKGRPAAERRLMVFVIRPDQPIHRIDLGPADEIADKVEAWNREVIGSRNSDGAAAREELGKLVWKPVEPFLRDVDTVVVSPDGALCQFPFAVLPGEKPSSYLIEDRKLAVIPVPRLLPQLLAQSYAAADASVSAAPLLIGNVDYDSDPGTFLVAQNDVRDRSRSREPEGKRAGERLEFKYLPGTKEEMQTIDQLYRHSFPGQEPHVLAGLEATEQAFREKAPRHRWVHLATHGYFLPPPATDHTKPVEDLLGARQEMHSSHPGLWSGIALSGANGRRETKSIPGDSADGKPPRDDGKLTALEVEGLDLMDVDLIVLSACQTALGRLTRGEGMLGLQRAFQLAGAKTAVTSLWTVDDTATRVLMTEFYRNLWEKKLPKLEALRQAQLRMLREYDPSQMKLASRGLDVADGDATARKRGSPYYWAAFVLSGDWR